MFLPLVHEDFWILHISFTDPGQLELPSQDHFVDSLLTILLYSLCIMEGHADLKSSLIGFHFLKRGEFQVLLKPLWMFLLTWWEFACMESVQSTEFLPFFLSLSFLSLFLLLIFLCLLDVNYFQLLPFSWQDATIMLSYSLCPPGGILLLLPGVIMEGRQYRRNCITIGGNILENFEKILHALYYSKWKTLEPFQVLLHIIWPSQKPREVVTICRQK